MSKHDDVMGLIERLESRITHAQSTADTALSNVTYLANRKPHKIFYFEHDGITEVCQLDLEDAIQKIINYLGLYFEKRETPVLVKKGKK